MILPLNESIQQTKLERPGNKWTVITRSILVLLMVQVLLGALSAFISLSLYGDQPLQSDLDRINLYLSLYGSGLNLLAILVLHFYVENRSSLSLGLGKASHFSIYVKGSCLLILSLLIIPIFYLLTSSIDIAIKLNFQIESFLLLVGGFILQALWQEVIFRGYIMNALCIDGKVLQGIWASAMMMALLYIFNSNIQTVGLVNVLLFSAILSYIFYLSSDLRLTSLLNILYHVILGPILGSHFQGQVYPDSLLTLRISNSSHVFSLDQNFLFTLLLTIFIVFLHRKVLSLQVKEEGNDSKK